MGPVSSSLFYTTLTRHAPLCPFKQKSKSRHEARSFRRVSSAHQRPSRGSPAKTWNHPSRFFATRSHVRRPFLKKNNTQTTPDRTVGLRNRPNQPFSPFFVFLVVVVEEQTTTTTTLLHRSSHFCLCSFFAWNPLNSLFPGLRCLPADLARPSPVGVGGETRKGTKKKRQKNQSDEERAVFLLFSPPAPRLLLQTVSANHSTANATESSLTHLLRSLLLCRCRRRVGG